MDIDNMKVGDLRETVEVLNALASLTHLTAVASLSAEDEELEEAMESAIRNFVQHIAHEHEGTYWTVARLVALSTWEDASKRILAGLKATQQ